MAITKRCETCGNEFEAGTPSKAAKRRFCSSICFGVTRQRREVVNCTVCSTPFERGGHFVKGSSRKIKGQTICSLECSQRARYRHGRTCNDLTVAQAAYLAGLWDADGSFIIHGRFDGHRDSLGFRAQIGITKSVVIDYIVEVSGIGSLAHHKSANPKHSDVYRWHVNGDGAETFAQQLLPYLVLKRTQAELGVDFQARLRDPKLKADRVWQQEYRMRMKQLNQRGPIEVEEA